MDLLHKFKQHGYFTSELYYLLFKKKPCNVESFQITPSEYEKEMNMTTQQRLQTLNSIEIDNIVLHGTPCKDIILSFTPKLLVFQNFKPHEKIVAKFTVRNNSKSPTHLSMVFKESSHFSIKPVAGQFRSRLAPGISVTFAITFEPMHYTDYTHRVTFYTDNDHYCFPIIAMGPRPLFDFPDIVKIPKTPLKIENHVLLPVHNKGAVRASFTLSCKCPFSVHPKSASLAPGEKIVVKITLKTMNLGERRDVLAAICETGEVFTIHLQGSTFLVSIELEKQIVRFFDTYNTLVRQQTFTITNKSEYVLTYMCMKNECVYYDFEEKMKLATMFYNVKESESAKYMKLVQFDVLTSDEHERVYTRIFYDEVHSLVADESLLFQNTHFSVTPIKGKLWPNKPTELTITFGPKEIGEFEAIIYFDIDGVDDRVPLQVTGISIPPSIHLNVETLNMDSVYINSPYNYEIIAMNRGHINGVIEYREVAPLFGSILSCSPALHCLKPGEQQIFVISFRNANQGPFFEEINFSIHDTDVILKLYLKGEVVYPTVTFSLPSLDFGMVSIGVPKTLDLEVINESVVEVRCAVKIATDGPEICSMKLEDYAVAPRPKPEITQWPREFTIEPCKIQIQPESRVLIKVTLIANLVRANQTFLELELDKSDSPPITLPLTFEANVPLISKAPDIQMRAAFVDYTYHKDVFIECRKYSGYFSLYEGDYEGRKEDLQIGVLIKEGFIEPDSTIQIPITIRMAALGILQKSIKLHIFGLTKPIKVCNISVCGMRPIVTCAPMALHWGQVKLLYKSHKTLTVVNDSPVAVFYKAYILNKDGRWQITPSEGSVEPEGEAELSVSLYLIDTGNYTNKAVLNFDKVKEILVPLSATGIGTSIVVSDLRDQICLGRHFTKIPLLCTVVMENCGSRLHSVEWSEYYKAPKNKSLVPAFFSFDPRTFKLGAREKMDLRISGISHKEAKVTEMWYLVGSVEGINKKELLLECTVTAEFVDPRIELSCNLIEFQHDYGPYSETYKLTEIMTIKNVSKLPLNIEIIARPPFTFIHRSTYRIPQLEEEMTCGCIRYDPADINVQNILEEFGHPKSQEFIDFLTNKPVEPHRTGSLNFFHDINKLKMIFHTTYTVEELLEDQEVMKVQILFDTTKHTTLKSKVYSDYMRIRFKGHKNKDAVRLIGKINFPNIFILTPKIDFQCILNGSIESRHIKLENVTPLLDCYRFQWKKCSIRYIDMPKFEVPKSALSSKGFSISSKRDEVSITIQNKPYSPDQDDIVSVKMENLKPSSQEIFPVQEITERSMPKLPTNFRFSKVEILKVIAPMISGNYQPACKWANKLRPHPKTANDINDIFQLVPHRGMLKPGEAQHVQVVFIPQTNISVHAILECEVLGGPSEMIQISGQSSELIYTINSTVINFGIRSFHEHASEDLVITNVAPLPFEYTTYLNEPKFETELEATILYLQPPAKQLFHGDVSEMQIVMRTGIVGYFSRTFLLEIGHFPHIPIQVFGWGVVPQIYLNLPRAPVMSDSNPMLGYLAIPTLTDDYLQARSAFSSSPQSNIDHANSPLLDKCFGDPDLHNDWHICSSWDEYPSEMDIELAIERLLVIDYVKLRPELLTPYSNSNKMAPLPGFNTKPYIIDFGVVITGSTIEYLVDVINYGPTQIKLHFARSTHLPSWLSVKLCGKLNPGAVDTMDVVFTSTSNEFSELEQDVETSFNLEVPYGVTIPIYIKALCAVPYLTSNIKMLDFGSVRCGDKVVASIPLKNVGKPTCIWYVTLKLKSSGPPPIMVLDNSGKYEPGEGGWLSIAFKPTMEMLYEGMLIFRFHMNPKKMVIPVLGQGLVPHVHVIGPNIRFPPTLPWAETADIYFGLTNPCSFPIELIVAHSDEKWKEEEEIYQLLCKYYNKPEEILIPAVIPGTGLPEHIINFWKQFKEQVSKTLVEETAAAAKSGKANVQGKKEKKSPKVSAKSQVSTKGGQLAKEVQPIRARTEAEIITDQIKTMKEKGVDPLKECFDEFDKIETDECPEPNPKGVLIFMHGSPCEESQCQEIAYSIGKELKIPTVNVDLCIVEALCVCQCPAREILLNGLNEIYDLNKRAQRDDLETELEDEFIETQDEFEIIWGKIRFLCNNKITKTPRKATEKKPKKVSTASLNAAAILEAVGSTSLFKMDLMHELLTDFFSYPRFDHGFVVDSLTSIVIKNSQLVLTTVLKCKRNILNIHLILCQSDFTKWAHQYEESLREAENSDDVAAKVYSAEEIKKIISTFEEMDADAYDNAPADLKAIYINCGLEARKKKFIESKQTTTHAQSVESMKKERTGKSTEHTSKTTLTAQGSDNRKKNKREDLKVKATHGSEFIAMSNKYNEYYKLSYEPLINVANNWILEECDVGYPLYNFNGQIVGAGQKKTKKRSDIQLQVSDDVTLADRGFPLTLIMCPCMRFKDALVNMFKYSPEVKKALKHDKAHDILLSPVDRNEYTIILPKVFPPIHHDASIKWRYLHEKLIKKCDCNQLTDLNLLDDSTQENVLHILSKWNCTCGKKMASSLVSTSDGPSGSSYAREEPEEQDEMEMVYPEPLPLHKVLPVPSLGQRLLLQPGDLVRCKYSFSPCEEGNFSVRHYVEVSGWPDSRIEINVNGICDLPRLDSRPKKMFEKFVRRTVENNVYKLTFLDDLKLFEFGPIFVGSNRVYEEHYSIDIKNASLITADVVVEFLVDSPVFQLDKKVITLEPGCRDKLMISAAPAEVGVHTTTLLFCVRDNPEIVMVNIACSGVTPSLEILPHTKHIEYGKHLLYRRADDRFIVKNDSILPVMWKIRNAEEFVEDFIIAQTSGIVPRYENQVVPITYIACRVGVIVGKVLMIDIYDAEGRGDPMIIDELHLSAECYDVMIECMHENPSDNSLNYGNVKVNSTVSREMYLLNRGKYNIYFRLKKVKNFPEHSLLKSFEAVPECGVIPTALKLIPIQFECTPTTSMNLVNVPAYTCSLLDGSKEQVVVAKFPVTVTIASFYNTFTLYPFGELNFNVIAVGTRIMKEVILNNTSKCPFTYEIVLPKHYRLDPDPLPVSAKKDNKIRHPPLQCGNFLIMNEDNLLAPGTSRNIQIQFHASHARKFEETVHFIISDTCPAEALGVPLNLVGTGAMPTLDLWNVESTFREHIIVKNLSDYKVPETSPHCVFAENSVTLHFFCVIVNTSYLANIDLCNNGLVACAVTMKLHYQNEHKTEIFSLDKYQTHIEPLLHKNLGIIFSPKALQEYHAVLEIKLKLLDNNEQSFKICLIGEGVIPRITLLTPSLRHHRIAMLQLPVTCLGSVTKKLISFQNVSPVKSEVVVDVVQTYFDDVPIFWITTEPKTDHMIMLGNNDEMNQKIRLLVGSSETATLNVNYNPQRRGRNSCDIKITIKDNPYEFYTIICDGEAFMEDVILLGLEMLPMDLDLEIVKSSPGTASSVSTSSKHKTRSAGLDKKKSKGSDDKRTRRTSTSARNSDIGNTENSVLKYLLDYGGCELSTMQKRSVVMVNNSEKVYKFTWAQNNHIVVKPSLGFISPGEEKDLEIVFFSAEPVVLKKEFLSCSLTAISDDSLRINMRGTTWDNRQIRTAFERIEEMNLNQRHEVVMSEQSIPHSEPFLGVVHIVILYSAMTAFVKYECTLDSEMILPETVIYQTRRFDFTVNNVGVVPIKLRWCFDIDDCYPSRIDKNSNKIKELKDASADLEPAESIVMDANNPPEDSSKVTLFSGNLERKSVDTWFEIDLPFKIEPQLACLKANESQMFTVTFSPEDAFEYTVRLKSHIENLDPYDQNISCKIMAKSLIPYVHLEIEECDYITSGRRKSTGMTLPQHISVLEFNVLGWGCYKKSFNVINPTSEGYEFIFEMVISDKAELVPVHCDSLKAYIEGGTSINVTFTFSPTAPGVTESHWKFIIPVYNLVMNLLVVGIVREPDVVFVPTILVIRNSLVGFTTTNVVMLKNNETDSLKFEFKGNSIGNESGITPVIVEPERGTLKPRSETPIKIIYTPTQDGPLSFKIFCSVAYLTKYLTLCVKALSYSIKPKVSYSLIGNRHSLKSEAVTNIHLDQTASTYERTIPFTIRNDGSATFFFDWHYNTAEVKKYLQLSVEPKSGHLAPGNSVDCTLHFKLIKVPVKAFPVRLSISDGPDYYIQVHAEIEKPLYHFSCMEYNFEHCFVNAPDSTYKKNIFLINDDKNPLVIDLNFSNQPELYVECFLDKHVLPGKRLKIAIFFRPKHVKTYEFKLQFFVNSLCEEFITIRGQGIPLLFDLYEGCQKSFDLGYVKVGEKIVRTIEVMNHSKRMIDASFIFKEMYPVVEDTTKSDATSVCLSAKNVTSSGDNAPTRVQMLQRYKDDKVREQIAMDIQNALSSLKVVPNNCKIQPYKKVPIKIQFKPIGMVSTLNVQLNMRVLNFERPLVRLSGCATGMSFCFNQSSLQFGRVRRHGCKILKVMLMNKGDYGSKFWWQPVISDEFMISPQQGIIAAHTNVAFTITFRPLNHNPFIKVWASCNIENYKPLELCLNATCMDFGTVTNKTMYMECPTREKKQDFVQISNPTDDMWLIQGDLSGGQFESLKEFNVEPNSTFDVPITFAPKTIGKHEGMAMYWPIGDSVLYVTLIGVATQPNANGAIRISVAAKDFHTEELPVYNITQKPETYVVRTEVVKIVPEKFEGHYEIKQADTIKTWGEAAAICRWTFVCYEECEMELKVLFINEKSFEYQFYVLHVTVTPSPIVDTLTLSCRARESIQKELVIKNPLSIDAQYSIYCEKLELPDTLNISRNSEALLLLTYSPLVTGTIKDRLEVKNDLVGTFIYKVILKCLPAKVKDLEISTSFGTSVPLRLKVENKTDTRADFECTFSHRSMQADRDIYTLGPHEKGKFVVWFEPIELGPQTCDISFNSPTAGEFKFHVKGTGTAPKPQGPYDIAAGGYNMIKFKNVYTTARTFKVYVDKEEFYVKNLYEPIPSKKEIHIQVFLNHRSRTGWTEMPTGTLMVENCDEPKVEWTYFLQGV